MAHADERLRHRHHCAIGHFEHFERGFARRSEQRRWCEHGDARNRRFRDVPGRRVERCQRGTGAIRNGGDGVLQPVRMPEREAREHEVRVRARHRQAPIVRARIEQDRGDTCRLRQLALLVAHEGQMPDVGPHSPDELDHADAFGTVPGARNRDQQAIGRNLRHLTRPCIEQQIGRRDRAGAGPRRGNRRGCVGRGSGASQNRPFIVSDRWLCGRPDPRDGIWPEVRLTRDFAVCNALQARRSCRSLYPGITILNRRLQILNVFC